MRNALLIGLAASSLLLGSCDRLLHQRPPAPILAGCPAVMLIRPTPIGPVTFGAMLEQLSKGGLNVDWEPTAEEAGVLRGARFDPLTRTTSHVAMQVSTDATTSPGCPNGLTLVDGMVVNDERLNPAEIMTVLNQPVSVIQSEQPTRPAAPPAVTDAIPAPLDAGLNQAVSEADSELPSSTPSPPSSRPTANSVLAPLAPAAVAGAMARGVVASDDVTWCCLTVGQIARLFTGDGGTVLLGMANGQLVISITDPRGRWNGWREFQISFDVQDRAPGGLVRPSLVSVDGRTVLTDDPAADNRISPLLRDSFHLRKTDLPDLDFGESYDRCSSTGAAGQGSTSAAQTCIDDELGRRDAALNQAYRAKLASLSPDRQLALREEERAWLRIRAQRCAAPLGAGSLDLVQATGCTVTLTVQRTGEIQRFR